MLFLANLTVSQIKPQVTLAIVYKPKYLGVQKAQSIKLYKAQMILSFHALVKSKFMIKLLL